MIKTLTSVAVAAAFLSLATTAAHATITITYGPTGAITSSDDGGPPIDGIEDTRILVVNNSLKTVNSLHLTSTTCIGCFDNDVPSIGGDHGYGGAITVFSNINNSPVYGLTANFTGGLAPGASTIFALEEKVSIAQLGTPEPATWAMMLTGFGLVGAGLRRRTALAA